MISVLDEDFTAINQYISQNNFSKLFILCDENSHEYCLPTLLGNLETDIPFELIEIEEGEDLKNIDTAIQLWEILTEFQADRKALLINLGGGVITDLGGFVASTYKRGIRFIHIPTTLLAMCDASIGGKTGIDHGFLKNLVGTFAPAENIFLYTNFLLSLDFVELRSGFAEMLKHGLINDAEHWHELIKVDLHQPQSLFPFIEKSMHIKQNIVDQDFKEMGLRKLLNFGHTVGHAVESGYLNLQIPIPHGEAVAMGMIVETRISFLENLISESVCDEIIQQLQSVFPYLPIDDFSNETLLSIMMNDKKNDHNTINFSLITGIGKGKWDVKCSAEHITEALEYYRNLKK